MDNFDLKKYLSESKLLENTSMAEFVEDYWSIMVSNQPEDVIKILVGLTNGDLSFQEFSSNVSQDIYDSFKDELDYDNN